MVDKASQARELALDNLKNQASALTTILTAEGTASISNIKRKLKSLEDSWARYGKAHENYLAVSKPAEEQRVLEANYWKQAFLIFDGPSESAYEKIEIAETPESPDLTTQLAELNSNLEEEKGLVYHELKQLEDMAKKDGLKPQPVVDEYRRRLKECEELMQTNVLPIYGKLSDANPVMSEDYAKLRQSLRQEFRNRILELGVTIATKETVVTPPAQASASATGMASNKLYFQKSVPKIRWRKKELPWIQKGVESPMTRCSSCVRYASEFQQKWNLTLRMLLAWKKSGKFLTQSMGKLWIFAARL